MNCPLCEEPIELGEVRRNELPPSITLYTPEGPRQAHRECMLREVMGGIGHHIAHEYCCTQLNDPDAGLTRRQSGLLVDAYLRVVGLDNAVQRSVIPSPNEEPPCHPSAPT